MSIAAFNIKTMEWVMLEAPVPPSLTFIRLMDHKGRLMMIGGLGMEGLINEIGIWQLDNSTKNWKRIGWIPKEVCDLFLMSATRSLSCTGHGDLIYFTITGSPFVIMYDLSRKHLKVLDPSPRLLILIIMNLRGFALNLDYYISLFFMSILSRVAIDFLM
ncbi:F-box/kelch-repeat protein At3g61590-like [Tasmannia lanceolata]|uniref:F-box/kelch-repeat protein At3g61590-like n=1 Tax=Tasmannia lanceolata TaxID=3420 RepID=UPI00406481AE